MTNRIESNPYIVCGELEESLNRNQRDVLDYFMIYLNQESNGIEQLLHTIRYIISNYDGVNRMTEQEIKHFWWSALLN